MTRTRGGGCGFVYGWRYNGMPSMNRHEVVLRSGTEIEVVGTCELSWRERQRIRQEAERQHQECRKISRALRELLLLIALLAGVS